MNKRKKIEIMLFVGVLTAALSIFASFWLNYRFKSTSDLMIVQNNQNYSDYFTAFKSSEYLSNILVDSIYSEKFLDEMSQNQIIPVSDFLPENKVDRLKKWKKMVSASINQDSGIVTLQVSANSSKEASEISESVVNVLTNKYSTFLGQGKDIQVQLLSGPLVESTLGAGKITGILVGGFGVGLLLSYMFLFFWQQEKDGEPKKEDEVSIGEVKFVSNRGEFEGDAVMEDLSMFQR